MGKISLAEKHIIRNTWCDMLCHIFNTYLKEGRKLPINTPYYTAKVLQNLGLIDYGKINHEENRFNLGQNLNSKNTLLVFECFDTLIKEKCFIGDYLVEFRNEFNVDMPW